MLVLPDLLCVKKHYIKKSLFERRNNKVYNENFNDIFTNIFGYGTNGVFSVNSEKVIQLELLYGFLSNNGAS